MDEIEKKARELLAAEYKKAGIFGGVNTKYSEIDRAAVAAIATALRSAQVLANRWQDEAAESWGETKEHATLQRCADKLRALLAAAPSG